MSGENQQETLNGACISGLDSIGITEYLRLAMDFLSNVINKPDMPESEKERIYATVFDHLEFICDKVEEIKKNFEKASNGNIPEHIKEITDASDGKFIKAADCHLDAIDALAEFLETDDDGLLEEARSLLEEGAYLVDEARSGYEEIKKIPQVIIIDEWGSEI